MQFFQTTAWINEQEDSRCVEKHASGKMVFKVKKKSTYLVINLVIRDITETACFMTEMLLFH